MLVTFLGGIIYGGLRLLLYFAQEDREVDNQWINTHCQHYLWICLLCGEIVYFLFLDNQIYCSAWDWTMNEGMLLGILFSVLASCLIMACITDLKYCMVYNYVWWIGGGGILGWLLFIENAHLREVLVFALLQELFFCHMYGKADCHAFVVCSLAMTTLGLGLREYLIHMLLAFGVLAVVQAVHKNINKKGNLKAAVPFLPYITITFWISLLFLAA